MSRVGDTREEYQSLFNIYWPIGVGIFVIILVLVVFVVLRYRSSSDEFPQGTDSSMPAEIGYAAFVGLIVAALLYFTYTTMSDEQSASAEAPGARISVVSAKWNWRFEYGGGVVEQGTRVRTPTLVVPAGTPVRFDMTSIDVIHSFWIPSTRFKRDAFPGRWTRFVLRFDEPGFFRLAGECNQFCGLLHAYMQFHLKVLPRQEYDSWLSRRRAEEASA